MNDIIWLILDKLQSKNLYNCRMVSKKWYSIVKKIAHRRLLDVTPMKRIPYLLQGEKSELDILCKFESFVGNQQFPFENFRKLLLKPIVTEDAQALKGPIQRNGRHINYVAEYQFDQDIYIKPTLLSNDRIVIFVESLEVDDCISMFLIDPFENKMSLLPWRLVSDTMLVSSIYCKWYICSNFQGEVILYDADTSESAVHQITNGPSEICVRGDTMLVQSSLNPFDTTADSAIQLVTLYKLPKCNVSDPLERLWTIQFPDERFVDFNDVLLASYEHLGEGIANLEFFSMENGRVVGKKIHIPGLTPDMFVSSFFMTRFHLILHHRQYVADQLSQTIRISIFDLKSMRFIDPIDQVDSSLLNRTLIGFESTFDEASIAGKLEENELMILNSEGFKGIRKTDEAIDKVGFWLCLDSVPMFWELPLSATDIFKPLVSTVSVVSNISIGNSIQECNIISQRDGCAQASHCLLPAASKEETIQDRFETGYYEVKILDDSRSESALAIGLAQTGYPVTMLPGWEDQSFAYHSDDGKIFQNNGEEGISRGQPLKVGDTCGIGYYYKGKEESKSERPISVFFTLNGERLEFELDDFIGSNDFLFPTIGVDGDFHLQIKFSRNYKGKF